VLVRQREKRVQQLIQVNKNGGSEMKKEVRHTTFFRKGTDLAVFARNVVDIPNLEVLGFKVEIQKIRIDASSQLDTVVKHFWVVVDIPPELIKRLLIHNHAVRGTSRYRVGQPGDGEALKLLRLAEVKAWAVLSTEEYTAST
jgi:hypothetical protein